MGMKYYQEITLLPDDTGISTAFLWSKVFFQLHLVLAAEKEKRGKGIFAVSFPQYHKEGLGTKLRVFAENEAALEELHLANVLQRFQEYVHITGVRPVRKNHSWAVYKRYQPDGSVHQKAKRYSKRHDVTYEEACRIMKSKKKETLPYIPLRSASNKQTFSLFIQKTTADEKHIQSFSAYGLSTDSTVPEF